MTPSAAAIGAHTCQALSTVSTVLVTDPSATGRARDLLGQELRAVDQACSRLRPDSELWRVNHARGRPVRVSPLLAEALTVALAAARVTAGDVDPTCGYSLVRLGYDRDFTRVRLDERPLRRPAVPAAGWRTVELDPGRRQVTIPEGVMLDLGATAKALAADRAATKIGAALGCGVLVNLGGDIRVTGDPPPGGWRVGIADQRGFAGPPGEPAEVVTIRDGGLATSATTARAWRRGPASLHHIIVPRTGLPADSCWRAVSVAAATCVGANTASTAAIVRSERAATWLAGLRLPARLVPHRGDPVTVGGWPPSPAHAAHA